MRNIHEFIFFNKYEDYLNQFISLYNNKIIDNYKL